MARGDAEANVARRAVRGGEAFGTRPNEENEEPTKWLGEMPKRMSPAGRFAVAKPSALDPIRRMRNEKLGVSRTLSG